MRLLGFNAGRIRTQTIDGEAVRTGYVKTPRPQPWIITPTGAEGDQVAVHSDHLYAFDRASYDHWAAELGAHREDWPDGHFAENLTLDVIDQNRLGIGDTYRLGSAILVVTGPRVPCWKLTWRLGQPKTFMRRFRLSGRSGAYFGVIEPGIVRPGEELVLLDGDPDSPTVAELSVLCDSGTRISAEQRAVIDRALACPHLSETVRGTLDLKLANLARDADDAPGWQGWRPFVIDAEIPETPDVTSFLLRPTDGGPLPGHRAGQHVVVRIAEPGAEPVVRTWSLSRYENDHDHYRISVTIRPGGAGSPALARAAAAGLPVELRAPAGTFHLDRGAFRPVVLVAAGIGITPMIAMVQAHLQRARHVPPLWILHGTPNESATPFRGYLDDVAARHPDVHLHYFHSRSEAAAPPAGAATVHTGRLTPAGVVAVMRDNYLRDETGAPADIPWFESDIYVCGSVEFSETLRDGLIEAGANPDLVFVEDFAAAAGQVGGPQRVSDAVVHYDPPGLVTTWVAARERTLLELAEDNGLELPFDCRAGTCRTCESRLLAGEVDGAVTALSDGTSRVLLCVSFPRSDDVTLEPHLER